MDLDEIVARIREAFQQNDEHGLEQALAALEEALAEPVEERT